MFFAAKNEHGVVAIISGAIGEEPESAVEIQPAVAMAALDALDEGAVLAIEGGALVIPPKRWFAHFNGLLTGFIFAYVKPEGALEISSEQYEQAMIAVTERSAWVSIENDQLIVTERPGPTVKDLVALKRADIDGAYERAMTVVKSQYPPSEIDGWPEQIAALAEYDVDPEAPNIIIDGLAFANVTSRADMAERIREKRNQFRVVYATLTGARQSLQNQLSGINLDDALAVVAISAIDESQLLSIAQQYQGGST